MSREDAKGLREVAGMTPGLSDVQRAALERIAYQLDSDAKRYEESEKLQEIGKSAMESIADMVAALDCDYDRLEELKELLSAETAGIDPSYADEREELRDLEADAGECKDREEAERRIREDPLSLLFRGDWYTDDTEPADAATPVEFELLLGTGGPAVRIIGELSGGEPTRARLQAQDWGTVWTDYVGADMDTLLSYCRCFYFGG